MELENVIHEVVIDYFTNNVNGINDKLNQATINIYKEALDNKDITDDVEYAQLIIKGLFVSDDEIKSFNHKTLTDYKDCIIKVQTIINNTINDKVARINKFLEDNKEKDNLNNLSKEELIDIIKNNKCNKCKE